MTGPHLTTARTPPGAARRWCATCLVALSAFQALMAWLIHLNRASEEAAFVAGGFSPTPAAAEGSVVGAVAVHLVLAVVCLVLARAVLRPGRWTRVRATVPLVATAVGGVAAMALPGQTWLSPVGVVLSVAALILLWVPATGKPALT